MTRTVLCAGLLATVTLHGQTPGPLAFEVASIKPNNSGSTRSGSSISSTGRYEGTNLTLHGLIQDAYRVREFQIVGGPDWIKGDRFDVIGKPSETAPSESLRDMLRTLLADRFKLVVHQEIREQPVYALTLAQTEGKLGQGLVAVDCSQRLCGNTNTNESNGSGTVKGTGLTMEDLAGWTANRVDRAVINRTGLSGTYDVDLKYTSPRPGIAPTNDAPSLFTALQEQLGLKLEGSRGPVEFIVIDHVERPSEN